MNRQPEDASEQHKVFQENGVIATCALTDLRCDDDDDCRYCLTPIAMALRDLSNKTGGSR